MKVYWFAKIWGLLHDPMLKALHTNKSRGSNSFWRELRAMEEWNENNWDPEQSGKKILKHIHLADYITSASDRAAIGALSVSVNYAPGKNPEKGLEISHLLSGAKLDFKIEEREHAELRKNRRSYLGEKENKLLEAVPRECDTPESSDRLFWWLWRCLPEVATREFNDESLMLMPAETRLPDSSIWNHASFTAAMAGCLAGCDLTNEDIEQQWSDKKTLSHAYLAVFSFSPVQELIKASRKGKDFWSGSWILHYLSAKVCWKLALIYGPDTIMYPSLFQQPLIDLWLRRKWPEFRDWVKEPSDRQLLTAGFPNVIVLILPKDVVAKAMQTAKQTVIETWRELSDLVFDEVLEDRSWMPDLKKDHKTWKGWLNNQWESYWTAVPIGKEGEAFKNADIPEELGEELEKWLKSQNEAYNLFSDKKKIFKPEELEFLRAAYQQRLDRQGRKFSVNIGSWWAPIFDQSRLALAAVKNPRNWQLQTAFGPRSTISGLGPVVHPENDWITEGKTQKLWKRQRGLFDGREQLNATETVKRCLEKVLPKLLEKDALNASFYPDLTSGVAGYLKVFKKRPEILENFQNACEAICQRFDWAINVIEEMQNKWGIPWIDDEDIRELDLNLNEYHPRLLNGGWLVEDAEDEEIQTLERRLDIAPKNSETASNLRSQLIDIKKQYRAEIERILSKFYPNNNPTSWYAIAAGDGDGMSEWLKGKHMKPYGAYTPSELSPPADIEEAFNKFLNVQKRMGPSTHSALSRALLDFSNQLLPYLTENRYAGRLIYGGGDDVLAYTNLWEWDSWLWDVRQCFKGGKDSKNEFDNEGNYWRWKGGEKATNLSNRPLFTMGSKATISFGIVLAHHSVPLAIALENMWEAEEEAKEHKSPNGKKKDAVQVRVIYGNGNILKATTKFDVFQQWKQLTTDDLESAMFEQAATVWGQHPAPIKLAIKPWTQAFCSRRDFFKDDEVKQVKRQNFEEKLASFIEYLWDTTEPANKLDNEVQNWLKLAAFVIRNRDIKI
jgi:CRISPR-associated protein Cmr2